MGKRFSKIMLLCFLFLLAGCEGGTFTDFEDAVRYLQEAELEDARLLGSEQISDNQHLAVYVEGEGILFVSLRKAPEGNRYRWKTTEVPYDFVGDVDYSYEFQELDHVYIMFGKILSDKPATSIYVNDHKINYDSETGFFYMFSEEPLDYFISADNIDIHYEN